MHSREAEARITARRENAPVRFACPDDPVAGAAERVPRPGAAT